MVFLLAGIASVFMLTALVACGGGAPAAEIPRVTPDSAPVIVTANDTPLPVVETALEVRVGSAVGERAPDFEVTFRDGSSVSREELTAEGRPAFLFFMATW